MFSSRPIRFLAIFMVLASTVGCDQATKQLARSQLSPLNSTTLPGGVVEFALAENPGAFLSFGASLPQSVRGALLTVGVGLSLTLLLAYLMRTSKLSWLSFL